MENSNMPRDRRDDHLGVNKMGRNIRKTPLQQPHFNNSARQQPQPQILNISKNDFRNVVQQLTGSPSRSQEPLPRPTQNSPKPSSMRLQRFRPPPLNPFNRPHSPHLVPAPVQAPSYSSMRPQFNHPSPRPVREDALWENTTDSPVSAYMRYLQSSIIDSRPRQTAPAQQYHPQHHVKPEVVDQPQAQCLPPAPPPNPHGASLPSQVNQPPLLPSPTSQFLLPSPTGYLNMFSPRSPYPLLSPKYQLPPMTPSFLFSPMSHSGILGPGPQPPPSPGALFPFSPSGLFPSPRPLWRDQ